MPPRKQKDLQLPVFPAPVSDPIVGLGKSPGDNLVQKSGPLYSLLKAGFTLQEFQLIDLYLARINSHDPTHCTVHIDLAELARCFGVKEMRVYDLQQRLARLGTMVRIEDPYNPKGFTMISLFTRAVCMPDEYGVWGVDLTCHPDARKYIFCIDNIGYFRYKLRSVLAIHSVYSYILFMYLELNRSLYPDLTWEVDVSDLRKVFMLEENAYPSFKVFNNRLLKLVWADIINNTDCKYRYETVKRGKYVKSVRFILEPLPLSVQTSGQESAALDAEASRPDEAPVLSSGQVDPWGGLTADQIDALRLIAAPLGDDTASIDTAIRQHIAAAQAYSAKNIFAYVRKSILEAAGAEIKKAKDADAIRHETDQRANEDMLRAMRLLAQFESDTPF